MPCPERVEVEKWWSFHESALVSAVSAERIRVQTERDTLIEALEKIVGEINLDPDAGDLSDPEPALSWCKFEAEKALSKVRIPSKADRYV